jgi:hemoglobin/transferrin/lactoferrin receptor protein
MLANCRYSVEENGTHPEPDDQLDVSILITQIKYMKKYTLIVLLLSAFTASSQVIQVKDAITLQPLEFVTVVDLATQFSIITDQKGELDLTFFYGSDSIAFSHLGYDIQVLSYSQATLDVLLMPKAFSLDDIVISANRWEQDAKEVPNRIVAINKTAITFYNPQTSADLLSQSGSVYIQKSQFGGGSPMIRGFATNRLLMVVDGVRMNNAIFRSGNIQNVLSIDPNALEGVEVIYGPGSIMYGSDALGGVMDFHTISPELSIADQLLVEGDAFGRYASANQELSGHLNVKLGGEKWASVTSLGYTQVGDLRMGSNGPDEYLRPEYVAVIDGVDSIIPNPDPEVQIPSDMQLHNVMQKLRYKPSDKWDLQYGFYWSQTSEHDRYDRLIEYRDGLPRSAEWYYGPMLWNMHSLKAQYTANNRLFNVAKLTLARQLFEESRIDRSFGKTTERTRAEAVDAYSANLDLQKQLGFITLYYGLEGVLNQVSSTGTDKDIITNLVEPAASRYPDGSNWQSYAGFFSAKAKLNHHVALHAGVRYNQVLLQAQFDTTYYPFPFSEANLNRGALTGSAGVAWQINEMWQWNINLSTGFRAPNIDDIGKVFDSEPGNVTVPNPDLLPEYAYNADMGWILRMSDMVEVQLTGFYTLLDNAIVRRDYLLNGEDSILYDGVLSHVLALQNVDEAFVYGLEAGFRWQPLRYLTVSSQLTWTEGREQAEETGSTFVPIRHAPPLYGTTHVIGQLQRFKADLYADYNAGVPFEELAPSEADKPHLYAIDDQGNPYAPSWMTINFKAGYQINNWLNVQAGVENITDKRYRTYSSGITAPGRNWILAIRASF